MDNTKPFIKNYRSNIFLFFVLLIMSSESRIYSEQMNTFGMGPVWSDEFSTATIDTSKWGFDIGTGAPSLSGWGNNELENYTSRTENIHIENGHLIIDAKKESYQNSNYTSARIKTKNKGDWTYGRFEICAKLPKGQGIWPAIWMLPTDNFYGGWAASGEIDIMEMLGHEPSKVYGTIHYGGVWPDNKSSGTSKVLPNGDFSQNFHLFVLEWDSTSLSWYVDSTLYQKLEHKQPFDKSFHLLINVAVGGNWPGVPNATTVFPQRMEIDFVRVYQQGPLSNVRKGISQHTRKTEAPLTESVTFTASGRISGTKYSAMQMLYNKSIRSKMIMQESNLKSNVK